jgi:ABC-type polysaccharide/polyol phosphate export permease
VLSVNPIAAAISGCRWAILGDVAPQWDQFAVGVVVSVLLFLLGLTVFRTYEPRFADTL